MSYRPQSIDTVMGDRSVAEVAMDYVVGCRGESDISPEELTALRAVLEWHLAKWKPTIIKADILFDEAVFGLIVAALYRGDKA